MIGRLVTKLRNLVSRKPQNTDQYQDPDLVPAETKASNPAPDKKPASKEPINERPAELEAKNEAVPEDVAHDAAVQEEGRPNPERIADLENQLTKKQRELEEVKSQNSAQPSTQQFEMTLSVGETSTQKCMRRLSLVSETLTYAAVPILAELIGLADAGHGGCEVGATLRLAGQAHQDAPIAATFMVPLAVLTASIGIMTLERTSLKYRATEMMSSGLDIMFDAWKGTCNFLKGTGLFLVGAVEKNLGPIIAISCDAAFLKASFNKGENACYDQSMWQNYFTNGTKITINFTAKMLTAAVVGGFVPPATRLMSKALDSCCTLFQSKKALERTQQMTVAQSGQPQINVELSRVVLR